MLDHKYNSYEDLLKNNQEWVENKLSKDKNYFEELSKPQKPPFLFIGCSDSRKPLNTITQTEPGEIFVHRNIANQISLTDMNFLSILEYAILDLKVEHIIVCGHYNCGGVEAVYKGADGLVENWIMPIKDLALINKDELEKIDDMQQRIDRLAEINVVAQVKNLCKTSIIHKAFKKQEYPQIHGWIFDIYCGKIKALELPLKEWKDKGIIPNCYYSQI